MVRMLPCLCRLSTRLAEGDASHLRQIGDRVSVSTIPGHEEIMVNECRR